MEFIAILIVSSARWSHFELLYTYLQCALYMFETLIDTKLMESKVQIIRVKGNKLHA